MDRMLYENILSDFRSIFILGVLDNLLVQFNFLFFWDDIHKWRKKSLRRLNDTDSTKTGPQGFTDMNYDGYSSTSTRSTIVKFIYKNKYIKAEGKMIYKQ